MDLVKREDILELISEKSTALLAEYSDHTGDEHENNDEAIELLSQIAILDELHKEIKLIPNV